MYAEKCMFVNKELLNVSKGFGERCGAENVLMSLHTDTRDLSIFQDVSMSILHVPQ